MCGELSEVSKEERGSKIQGGGGNRVGNVGGGAKWLGVGS